MTFDEKTPAEKAYICSREVWNDLESLCTGKTYSMSSMVVTSRGGIAANKDSKAKKGRVGWYKVRIKASWLPHLKQLVDKTRGTRSCRPRPSGWRPTSRWWCR